MKIFLANPKTKNTFRAFSFIFPPTGLLYVGTYARKKGLDVTVEDFNISSKDPGHFDFRGYDVVGITSNTMQSKEALAIASEARKSGCRVVMGGPHASFLEEEMLKTGLVDFIVKGEGEVTFYELICALRDNTDLSYINGISFCDNDAIIRTPPRELIQDLNSLPIPERDMVDLEAYKKAGFKYGNQRDVTIISTSRGCSHGCYFCSVPSVSGKKWRYRSVDSVMTEIEEIYTKYGYRAIAFSDDNFTLSPKRVKEICERIIEKDYDLWWWCMSSPDTLTRNEDMVAKMSKSGAKTVFIGVESANNHTLKEFKKKMDDTTAERAVNVLKKHKIEIYGSFILGEPSETVQSVFNTIKLAKKLSANIAQFTILTPYPGTAFYEEIKDKITKRQWTLFDGFHLVFKHKNMSAVTLQLLLLWAYISYYTRSLWSIKGFLGVFANNNQLIKKWKRELRY